MDPMVLYPGEKRFLYVDVAASLGSTDSLTGTPTAEVVVKRGRATTTLVVNSPAAPTIVGTQIWFWVDVPDEQTRAMYLAIVRCPTAAGETAKEEAPLLVK